MASPASENRAGPALLRRTSGGPTGTRCCSDSPRWWKSQVRSPRDEPFRVQADPTRRRIPDPLAERDTQTVSQLAAECPDVVAAGNAKHLMAPREAGLGSATRRGREQLYRIDAEA